MRFTRHNEQMLHHAVRVSYNEPNASAVLAQGISEYVRHVANGRPVAVMCVGTDRSTGDALGPLVGSRLCEQLAPEAALVLGTLDEPVHAVNLAQTIIRLQQMSPAPFIIAVDACLGQVSSVGQITLQPGPLHPGAGVNKQLPAVGDIHITGIVNVGGYMEYFVLQNTRLQLVFRMARAIADGLCEGLSVTRPSAAGLNPWPTNVRSRARS
ncbi:MAG: spore protease YyaC [Kyrpidia sp.]|nr:spore protease YyaC [Kyrpidia sp.]